MFRKGLALLGAFLFAFVRAAAAWVGVLNHMTAEGGIPLSNGRTGSVWGHVLVESLPQFAAVAEERGPPMVMGSWDGAPVDAFMGKGAAYADGALTFEIRCRHEGPLPVRIFFPAGPPTRVTVNGAPTPHQYHAARRILRLELPPAADYARAKVVVSQGVRN